jgi:peptidoglycan/xylan/chitin deacetylase (PgdA/CDA1 family)
MDIKCKRLRYAFDILMTMCEIKTENLNIDKETYGILQKCFELLTCQEEYCSKRDEINRFLGKYSIRKDIHKPIVNYMAKTLESKCANKSCTPKTKKGFLVVLSHDVDNITDKNIYVLLSRLAKCLYYLKKLQLRRFMKQLGFTFKRLFSISNPYNNFDKYMSIEEEFGFRSTFFFMCGQKGRYGARYSINQVKQVMRRLSEQGWEIGLHTNFDSYDNVKKIKQEKKALEIALGEEIIGCRNHYLRFKVPDTWGKIKEAGFKYDSTLGFTDTLGFRAGIAFPFFPYNSLVEGIVRIIEIPLVIMDAAILHEKCPENAWHEIKTILNETKNVNGVIALNFHQRILYEQEFPGWGDVYIKILQYIKENGGMGVTGKYIFDNRQEILCCTDKWG